MDYTQDYRWRDISFHLWHSSSLCHFLSLSPHNIPSFSALLSHTSTALTLYFTPSLDSTCHLSLFLSPPTLPNYLVPLSHTLCPFPWSDSFLLPFSPLHLCLPVFQRHSLLSTCVFLSFNVTPFLLSSLALSDVPRPTRTIPVSLQVSSMIIIGTTLVNQEPWLSAVIYLREEDWSSFESHAINYTRNHIHI